jgi:cytochrome b561
VIVAEFMGMSKTAVTVELMATPVVPFAGVTEATDSTPVAQLLVHVPPPPPPHPAITRVAANIHQAVGIRMTNLSLGVPKRQSAAFDLKPGALVVACACRRFAVRASNRQPAPEGPKRGAWINAQIESFPLQPNMLNQFTSPCNAKRNTLAHRF